MPKLKVGDLIWAESSKTAFTIIKERKKHNRKEMELKVEFRMNQHESIYENTTIVRDSKLVNRLAVKIENLNTLRILYGKN